MKPHWLKVKAPSGDRYLNLKNLMRRLKLATVCESAKCPNIGECWSQGTATIMIMGDVCTRGCRFCNVKTGNPKGVLDPTEPEKVAFAVGQMKDELNYIVITSVDRDDLPDHGAYHFYRTVRAVKAVHPDLLVEVLIPDFGGVTERIHLIIDSGVDVLAHNVETVARLQSQVRDRRANYEQSLKVLETAKKYRTSVVTKTSIMLGLGETHDEIKQTLQDLRSIGVDAVTLGQYLQPSSRHLPVQRYVQPDEFQYWEKTCLEMGFLYVASGPLVRSSYRAGEFYLRALVKSRQGGQNGIYQVT